MNRGSPTEQGTRQWFLYRHDATVEWQLVPQRGQAATVAARRASEAGFEVVPVVPAVVDEATVEKAARAIRELEDKQRHRNRRQPVARALAPIDLARAVLKAAGLTVEGEGDGS